MTRKFFISISDTMDVRRWTIDQSKGKRNHMEDMVDVQETNGTKYFAIFDGHSGAEAATFAKKNIWQILERDERLSHSAPETVKLLSMMRSAGRRSRCGDNVVRMVR